VVEGDDHCEAYTTIMWGRLLSRERYYAAEAEAVDIVEGNMCGPVMRGSIAQPWSKTLSRTKGTSRNLGDLAFGRAVGIAPVRMGKVMSRSLDERTREVRPRSSSCEVHERSWATRGGVDGAKGGDQGKCGLAKHAPNSVSGWCVTCAGSHTTRRALAA